MTDVWEVGRTLLATTDTSPLERLLANLEETPEQVRQAQGAAVIAFPDLEDGEVPLLIPDVRRYLRALHDRVTHLWYYLKADPEYGNLLMFMTAYAPDGTVVVRNGKLAVEPTVEVLEALRDHLTATAAFAQRMADEPERIVGSIVEPLPLDEARAFIVKAAVDATRGR